MTQQEITKHEWQLHHVNKQGNDVYNCMYCHVKKVVIEGDDDLYLDYRHGESEEEPACITRKITDDVH